MAKLSGSEGNRTPIRSTSSTSISKCSYAFIQKEIENSCAVDAVYLDFKKALTPLVIMSYFSSFGN